MLSPQQNIYVTLSRAQRTLQKRQQRDTGAQVWSRVPGQIVSSGYDTAVANMITPYLDTQSFTWTQGSRIRWG